MVETCDRRTGECAHETLDSIRVPQTTAKAAIRATANCASMLVPGRASVSRRVTAPLSHSTPLTRAASATSPGLSSRSWPHDDISARRCVTWTSLSHARSVARTGSSVLLRRAPERGAPADRGALHLGAAARAEAAAPARRRSRRRCGRRRCGSPRASRRAARAAGGRARRRSARRPGGADRRARQRVSSASRLPTPAIAPWSSSRAFIGERPAPDARAEHVARDLGGVGADCGEVGLQDGAAEAALVAQRQPAAVGEVERRSGPSRSAPAPRRPRSAPPSRGAARGPARRRSRPT